MRTVLMIILTFGFLAFGFVGLARILIGLLEMNKAIQDEGVKLCVMVAVPVVILRSMMIKELKILESSLIKENQK